MKKTFEFEWPDDYGPEWLCLDNLKSLLYTTETMTKKATAREVPGEDAARREGYQQGYQDGCGNSIKTAYKNATKEQRSKMLYMIQTWTDKPGS